MANYKNKYWLPEEITGKICYPSDQEASDISLRLREKEVMTYIAKKYNVPVEEVYSSLNLLGIDESGRIPIFYLSSNNLAEEIKESSQTYSDYLSDGDGIKVKCINDGRFQINIYHKSFHEGELVAPFSFNLHSLPWKIINFSSLDSRTKNNIERRLYSGGTFTLPEEKDD